MGKYKVIAIDGPSGSGKGTICKELTKITGYFYVDSGVYYRAITYLVQKNNIDPEDIETIVKIGTDMNVHFEDNKILLNGEDVTTKIRTEEINVMLPKLTPVEEIRNVVNTHVRNLTNNKNIIIDGRDTTTVLFPNADYKFYVDCEVETRARRRYEQELEMGMTPNLDEIRENIIKRDYKDTTRKIAPLIRNSSQIYIDTTNDTIEESVKKIMEKLDNKVNLKKLYIDFFVSKGHKQIPSAPVVPENDPSVLFNTAGMQPLIPYLMGQTHPYGTRLTDYQKCVRTNDLDNIGDTYHHTFFEMLGNWSLGDYFKEDAIKWSFEFLTQVLNIPVERLAVTVFAGNDLIPFDSEAHDLWLSLGIPKLNHKL